MKLDHASETASMLYLVRLKNSQIKPDSDVLLHLCQNQMKSDDRNGVSPEFSTFENSETWTYFTIDSVVLFIDPRHKIVCWVHWLVLLRHTSEVGAVTSHQNKVAPWHLVPKECIFVSKPQVPTRPTPLRPKTTAVILSFCSAWESQH